MTKIPKQHILTEIRKTTQYIGLQTKSQDGQQNVLDAVGAEDENEEILWRFVCECITEVRTKGISVTSDETDTYVVGPDDMKEADDQELEENLRPYLIYAATHKWLMLGNIVNDRMPLYKQLSALYLSKVRMKLMAYAHTIGQDETADNNNTGGYDVPVIDGEEAPDEEEGGNDSGTTDVPTIEGEDAPDEEEADGSTGSFDVPVIDGEDAPDEEEEQATIGQDLPQYFGEQRVTVYRTLNR